MQCIETVEGLIMMAAEPDITDIVLALIRLFAIEQCEDKGGRGLK